MSRTFAYGVLAVVLLAACEDSVLRAFGPRTVALGGTGGLGAAGEPGQVGGAGASPDAGVDASTEAGADSDAGAGTTAGAAGVTSTLLIDDFEDIDTRAKESLGWWYPINDESGTQGLGIEPVSRSASNVYALRTHGNGFNIWGAAIGLDLRVGGTPFNALGYKAFCFEARVEPTSSTLIQVHFLRGADHYIQEQLLSETWTQYCLPLADFIGPNQTMLDPDALTTLQFFFPPNSPFLFWLDNVELVP